mmetsp:Transcript_8322/g.18626  ORF Transcript_8322/g.18626 Transcript_8322/m.18626 type:complete len:179 (-) Transcript_8322:3050-3586(-)
MAVGLPGDRRCWAALEGAVPQIDQHGWLLHGQPEQPQPGKQLPLPLPLKGQLEAWTPVQPELGQPDFLSVPASPWQLPLVQAPLFSALASLEALRRFEVALKSQLVAVVRSFSVALRVPLEPGGARRPLRQPLAEDSATVAYLTLPLCSNEELLRSAELPVVTRMLRLPRAFLPGAAA